MTGRKVRRTVLNLIACSIYSCGLVEMYLNLVSMQHRVKLGMIACCAAALLCTVLELLPLRPLLRRLIKTAALLGAVFVPGGVGMVQEMIDCLRFSGNDYFLTACLFSGEIAVILGVVLAFFHCWYLRDEAPLIAYLLMAIPALWSTDSMAIRCICMIFAGALLSQMSSAAAADGKRMAAALLVPAILAGGAWLMPLEKIRSQQLMDFGDSFRQKVSDLLFFTEPRDVFSLRSVGYYPQGSNQLGGPIEITDEARIPLMQVVTPKMVHLRGSTKNIYDGHGWTDTTGGRRYQYTVHYWKTERTEAFDEDLPAGRLKDSSLLREQTVRVRMLQGSASSIFVPQRVRSFSAGGDLTPYFNRGSELFVTRNLKAGDNWTVSAPLMEAGDMGLQIIIDACSRMEDSRYSRILSEYTQLPEHLQQMVYDLAESITADALTPYDKALALRNWLMRNCRYRLDVEYHPVNVDFVTRFLFQTREGYCVYFASAMTILCRMVGIPARYVEGFLAKPDENGQALVSAANAHAWTEIYLKGFGWLTIDATAAQGSGNNRDNSQNNGTEPPEEPQPLPETTPEPEKEQQPEEEPDDRNPPEEPENIPDENRGRNSIWFWLILILLLLAARLAFSLPEMRVRLVRNDRKRLDIWTDAVLANLAAGGKIRSDTESVGVFLSRSNRQSVVRFGEALYGITYGDQAITAESLELGRSAWEETKRALPLRKRAALILKRAYLPGRQ